MDNNSVIVGFAIGAIIPVIGFIVIENIFEYLTTQQFIPPGGEGILSSRMRTIFLLAICSNLIPFHYFKRKKYDLIMRGLIFPTLIYVAYWLYTYKSVLGIF